MPNYISAFVQIMKKSKLWYQLNSIGMPFSPGQFLVLTEAWKNHKEIPKKNKSFIFILYFLFHMSISMYLSILISFSIFLKLPLSLSLYLFFSRIHSWKRFVRGRFIMPGNTRNWYIYNKLATHTHTHIYTY